MTQGKARNMRLIAITTLIVLIFLVIWQNSASTTLRILVFSAELPLMVWLGVFFVLGFLLGLAMMWTYRRRQ